MNKKDKIYVAGGTGMVGRAIIRRLKRKRYTNIVSTYHRRKPQDDSVDWHRLDLKDQSAVRQFFAAHKPDCVFLAAAKVGGIGANNQYRADFLYDNLQIQNNIIHSSYQSGVDKLLFLGSSCIYPRDCPQPIKEEYLLTEPLEYTNEPYAVAKIAGMKLCESFNLQYGTNFLAVMPTNLYGPGDNFDLETSHVLPALIRKFHLGKCLEQADWSSLRSDLNARPINGLDGSASSEAILQALAECGISFRNGESQTYCEQQNSSSPTSSSLTSDLCPLISVRLWGTGTPRREFLHVDDLAEACCFVMGRADFRDLAALREEELGQQAPEKQNIRNTHVNIGCGSDLSIQDLAESIQSAVGFQGQLLWDSSKPDGTPRKLLNVDRIHSLGWRPSISLNEGIQETYDWYLSEGIE
ncbi:MAG: GDP-L-fucose synthase [Desulfohalobiaceae bacterium]|nr:GDP-L-fucose synthase [Desulfohalobiaceae bacterium]